MAGEEEEEVTGVVVAIGTETAGAAAAVVEVAVGTAENAAGMRRSISVTFRRSTTATATGAVIATGSPIAAATATATPIGREGATLGAPGGSVRLRWCPQRTSPGRRSRRPRPGPAEGLTQRVGFKAPSASKAPPASMGLRFMPSRCHWKRK